MEHTKESKPAPVAKAAASSGESAGQADFYIKLGRQKLDAGDYSGAAQQFTKARDVEPKNADAVSGLGECAFEEGNFDRAAGYFRLAGALAPKKSRYAVRLGQVYYKLGKLKDAVSEYRRALKMDPKNQEAQQSLQLAESKLAAGG